MAKQEKTFFKQAYPMNKNHGVSSKSEKSTIFNGFSKPIIDKTKTNNKGKYQIVIIVIMILINVSKY